MSEDDKQEAANDEKNDETGASSEKFDLSDEGKEKVREMRAAYDDDRQTAVLPGTGGTITGVAINEWLDDDGNPKFGKDEQKEKDEKAQHQEKEKQEQTAD
ncbi:hypothetical protein GCM10009641_21260 [Mycobacterium cookii]|uniref:Uncharacterized protein n=1 Tax=Mycobacterium cookii TaxID=1775 RepID=A0A7I7KTP2_9MYCO|nr:hypothetical protein [Mycobacterium cookii]MCV7328665.1 hypothetical protein [Mycobacterium cookii]BBX45283.1 hypothetical protein MCOO_12980 [Mycobacterium cookii]